MYINVSFFTLVKYSVVCTTHQHVFKEANISTVASRYVLVFGYPTG